MVATDCLSPGRGGSAPVSSGSLSPVDSELTTNPDLASAASYSRRGSESLDVRCRHRSWSLAGAKDRPRCAFARELALSRRLARQGSRFNRAGHAGGNHGRHIREYIILAVAPHLPDLPFVRAGRAPIWKRLLVCFYGGIDEEVLTRLFLLTLFAWLGLRIFQKQKARLLPATFWIANVVVAILFGLGHLPGASRVMQITPEVVLLALALNGVAAVSFGYLYWKRGLESAMIAHFCADFVVYVVGVAFLKN